MLQAQINGGFTTDEQALKCRICGDRITDSGNKAYISAGIKRGRAVHKHCKQEVKTQQ